MSADWNDPTNSTTYTSVLSDLNSKILALAKQDYTGYTTLATNSLRWNDTDKQVEKWNGSAWVVLNDWANWTPTLGASGSMTYTSTSITFARYRKFDQSVSFAINVTGTIGGTVSDTLTFTLPVAPASLYPTFAASQYQGFATNRGACAAVGSGSTVNVTVYDGSNWGSGANKQFFCAGIYEI